MSSAMNLRRLACRPRQRPGFFHYAKYFLMGLGPVSSWLRWACFRPRADRAREKQRQREEARKRRNRFVPGLDSFELEPRYFPGSSFDPLAAAGALTLAGYSITDALSAPIDVADYSDVLIAGSSFRRPGRPSEAGPQAAPADALAVSSLDYMSRPAPQRDRSGTDVGPAYQDHGGLMPFSDGPGWQGLVDPAANPFAADPLHNGLSLPPGFGQPPPAASVSSFASGSQSMAGGAAAGGVHASGLESGMLAAPPAMGNGFAFEQPIPANLLGDIAPAPSNAPSSPPAAAVVQGEGGGASSATPSLTPAGPAASAKPLAVPNFAKLPLFFEQNVGQVIGDSGQVRYLARGGGYTLFLSPTESVYTLARPAGPLDPRTAPVRDAIRMQFVGTNSNVQIAGLQELPSRSNYFVGNDATRWYGDVVHYAQVSYHNLWQGVDLVYYASGSTQKQLEYDFVVAPGTNPSVIQLGVVSALPPVLDANGNMILTTASGTQAVQQAPVMFQWINGVKQTITGNYLLTGASQFGFSVGSYDTSKPLYIDPVLSYSSYLGGSGDDFGYGIAVDNSGQIVVTGSTASANFPTLNPLQLTLAGLTNAFVSKFNAAGTALIYSTYLGGSNNDQGNGIALDPAGNSYIVGNTNSTNFPTTTGAYQTSLPGGSGTTAAFVSKISSTGDSLLYSTYLGPTTAGNSANGNAIAVDANGSAYVTGYTASGFPTTAGAAQTTFGGGTKNAFVTKLNPAGSGLVYSTYLGGSGADIGYGIALDQSNAAYVTGSTTSTNFPVPGGFQTTSGGGLDAFVTKVAPNGGSFTYSSYLGGSWDETGYAITVDRSGNAYVTGSTTSSNFPTTVGAYQTTSGGGTDAFITKVKADGSAKLYSTYLGGSGTDVAYGIAVDVQGNATVTGQTSSSNFPTLNPIQSSLNGSSNAFITQMNAAGSALLFSSFLGGSGTDAGQAVVLDPQTNAYITGWTRSTNFPTANPFQATSGGGSDAFVSKITIGPPPPTFTAISPDTGVSSSDQITTAQNLTLSGLATPNSTVTVSRAGVGVLGTTTANPSGNWSYNYTGTTLPEGSYAFTATATLNGQTSQPSAPFLVTVDLTAPTVALALPSSNTSFSPQVRVNAGDLIGVPNDTTNPTYKVYLDVDLNNDGNFTDAAETNYASGTLHDGFVTITLPALTRQASFPMTYPIRAKVYDVAGNLTTTASQNLQVVSSGSTWPVTAQVLTADLLDGQPREQLGDLYVEHQLDLDKSPGTRQSGNSRLVYNSSTVNVQPIVQGTIPTDNSQTSLPPSITATLTWNGTAQAAKTFVPAGTQTPGDVLTIAVQSTSVVTSTARYPWSLQVTMNYGTPITRTVSGTAYVVTQDASPFGSGWSLSMVDQLLSIPADVNGPAGMLRLYGTGGARFYQGTTTFTSPPGDNGTLTLSGGVYTYTTPDGRKWNWNSSGQMTSWVSADGQETLSFSYTSGLLTSMTAIDGATTAFNYTSGLLSTIVTTTNTSPLTTRTATLSYTGTNLTTITNPDNGLHTLTYDGSHHLTGEAFANLQNQWAHAASGTLNTITWGSSSSPSVSVLSPAVVQGLAPASGNGTPVAGSVQASLTDPLNHTTRWQLDGLGRRLQQLAADGGVSKWTRDPTNGWVLTATDPLNRTTTYTRDSLGFVTQETLPDGNSRNYAYQSAFHALTTLTDERSYTTTYAYDNTNGHLLSTTDPLGNTTAYAYVTSGNGVGLVQSATDPLGHKTTYAYDSARRLWTVQNALPATATTTYDNYGNPLTTVDPLGHTTTSSYDVMSRLTQTTDPKGYSSSTSYNAAGLVLTTTDQLNHTTSTIYDAYGRALAVRQIGAVGSSVERDSLQSFDSAGNLSASRNTDGFWTNYGYDPVGRINLQQDSLGGKALTNYDLAGQQAADRDRLGRWSKYAYNLRGWQTQSADALGNTTTTAYDQAGNATAVTDPLGHTTSYQYDQANRQTVVTDPLGKRVTTSYDKAGNVLYVTDHLGHITSYAYDNINRRTQTIEAFGTTNQRTLTTTYDNANNVTVKTDGLGNTVTYVYDERNLKTEVHDGLNHITTTAYDQARNAQSVTDPLSKTTSYGYDALNRQIQALDPLSHATTTILDAMSQSTGSIDAMGNVPQQAYDMLGRRNFSVDPRGAVVQTGYDGAGNTQSLTDPVANQTTYVLDGLNRVVQRTDPVGKSGTSTYDNAGRLTSTTDRRGWRRDLTYDNANRLTGQKWYDDNTILQNTVTYTYDDKGNLKTAGDQNGTYTMTYDELDRLRSATNPFGITLTYTYDKADRRTQVQDSLGGVATGVYDNANRLTSRQFGGTGQTPLRLDLSYSDRNELTKITRYNDLAGNQLMGSTTDVYDDAGRVQSVTNYNNVLGSLGNYGLLSQYTSGYDNDNRATGETYQTPGNYVTTTYVYDTASELTNVTSSTSRTSYTYDLNGNRTNFQTGADNRLTSDGAYTYTYDNEGNLTQKSKGTGQETWYLGYDNLNHLTTINKTSDGTISVLRVTYTYDIFGNRIQQQKWTSTQGTTATTRYAYDGHDVWADVDSSNNVLVRYVHGDAVDQLFARIVSAGQPNPGVAFYLTDRLGSVRDLMDTTSTIQDHLDYDGFGNVTETVPTYGDRYKFTAHEYDPDTTLQFNGQRYYSPATGRWVSQASDDSNPYRYVRNAPTNASASAAREERSDQVGPGGVAGIVGTIGGALGTGAGPLPGAVWAGVTDTAVPQLYAYPPLLAPLTGKQGAFLWPITWVLSPKNAGKKGGAILQHVHISYKLWDWNDKLLLHSELEHGWAQTLFHPDDPKDEGKTAYDYWEAWLVPPGKNAPEPVALNSTAKGRKAIEALKRDKVLVGMDEIESGKVKADDWYGLLAPKKKADKIRGGWVKFDAEAYYYEGMTQADLTGPDKKFFQEGSPANPFAGNLLSYPTGRAPNQRVMADFLKNWENRRSSGVTHSIKVSWDSLKTDNMTHVDYVNPQVTYEDWLRR